MNAPLFSLSLLFLAPLLAAWKLRAAAPPALGLAAAAWWTGEGLTVACRALAEGLAAAALLAAWTRWAASPVAPLASWAALGALPWWAPEIGERLAGPAAPLSGAWWAAWPGGLLASEAWDPLQQGPLYALWGARVGVPGAPLWTHLFVLTGAAAFLYWRCRLRGPVEPEPPQTS